MYPHVTHLLTHFWLLSQNGRQVNAWILYCTCHARQQHVEHAIWSTMISRMCSCSFMAMTLVVLALWLSADSTQILNGLLLQCAYVNHVAVCAFAFSAMDTLIWYQFCEHCAMFAFLDGVCQGIVIWHALHSTFAAVEYKPWFDTMVRQTPMLCAMALHLTCMIHPHETHLLAHFWPLSQYGWQVQAWIVYCTHHGLHRHEEHAIGSVMISRMCNLWLETKCWSRCTSLGCK